MELRTEEYGVVFEPETATVRMTGILRLMGSEGYAPIGQLLERAAVGEQLTLDLRQLEFLNSSGINMLSRFVLNMRRRPEFRLCLLGSQENPWHAKSLLNLQRLMPNMELRMSQ